MLTLLVYTVSAFGLAYIVGHAQITLAFRAAWADTGKLPWLLDLVECPACFGFWIGLATSIFWSSLFNAPFNIMLPFYTSGANFLLGRLTGLVPKEE